jgi:NAD(P)H-hydrate repair Nnr-like enzyme with NAD(P)H-hydrate dehydratase domain
MVPPAPEGHRPPDVAKRGGHKYDHGHAVIVSGPAGRTGAARLAARAALRIGAGLVTVASPSDALAENAAHLTAVMVRPCDGAEALAEMLRDARFNAICLGPGMGVGEATRAMVLTAMGGARKVVLDADALTSFADAPDALFDAIAAARARDARRMFTVVLTPHAGEFRRLFPDLAEHGRGGALSKLDATREAAGVPGRWFC